MIPGADSLVLVDVEALSPDTACVLGTSFDGGLARAYRTTNGGRTWSLTYELRHPQVFLDGLAFWDRMRGVAFGDPVDGAFFVLRTEDGCASWLDVPLTNLPRPLPGEAGFAASGTAIAVAGIRHAWFGTGGGASARVLRSDDGGRSWEAVVTPMPAGPATGIFGVAFRDTLHGIAVGGNYLQPAGDAPNLLVTSDGGRSWRSAGPAIKATKVDGIYAAHPVGNPNAERFYRLGYDQVIESKLGVMDTNAIVLCRDQRMPIRVFNVFDEGDLVRIVKGEAIGTLVS